MAEANDLTIKFQFDEEALSDFQSLAASLSNFFTTMEETFKPVAEKLTNLVSSFKEEEDVD